MFIWTCVVVSVIIVACSLCVPVYVSNCVGCFLLVNCFLCVVEGTVFS